jgi:hypothetical protein
MSLPFLTCMVAAAAFYHLPPRVLPTLQAVEGGQVGLVHMNPNNSADLGLMQINTIWVQPLARYANISPATVVNRLRNDGCFGIAAAAAIMRVYLTEANGDLITAIGYYHSHTPERSAAYAMKVLEKAGTLFGGRDTRTHR